jgi:hypothetical protein
VISRSIISCVTFHFAVSASTLPAPSSAKCPGLCAAHGIAAGGRSKHPLHFHGSCPRLSASTTHGARPASRQSRLRSSHINSPFPSTMKTSHHYVIVFLAIIATLTANSTAKDAASGDYDVSGNYQNGGSYASTLDCYHKQASSRFLFAEVVGEVTTARGSPYTGCKTETSKFRDNLILDTQMRQADALTRGGGIASVLRSNFKTVRVYLTNSRPKGNVRI